MDPNAVTLKIARLNAREKERADLLGLVKDLAKNPIFVGAAALGVNEVAYRAGLYDPRAGEKNETVLGGPVWFQIGPGLSIAQERRNAYRGWIMAITTAMAMAPAASAGFKTVSEVLAVAK